MYRNAIVILGMSVSVVRDCIITENKHAMKCTASGNTSLGVGVKKKQIRKTFKVGVIKRIATLPDINIEGSQVIY